MVGTVADEAMAACRQGDSFTNFEAEAEGRAWDKVEKTDGIQLVKSEYGGTLNSLFATEENLAFGEQRANGERKKEWVDGMPSNNEIWYAAKSTQICYMPKKLLETFGETHVKYSVVSELETEPGHVRLRRGLVKSARPLVVTPHYFRQQMLENFGDEARQYLDYVLNRQDSLRIVQYGLCFMKQEYSEEVIGGTAEEVAEQLSRSAAADAADVQGVLIGPDAWWEVSLMRFINELVKQSAPQNARDMMRDGMFSLERGIPAGVRMEIDMDFESCDSLSKAEDLGGKLRDYGLFDDYEDRFYDLYMRLKR